MRVVNIGFNNIEIQPIDSAITIGVPFEYGIGCGSLAPKILFKVIDIVPVEHAAAVNIARFLKVDPESALRRTNHKFRSRFQWVEAELRKAGKSPRESTLEEMDSLWEQSKQIEEEVDR